MSECGSSPGYIVFSGPRRTNGVQGLRFIIQSEKAPHYLESRVEAFLSTMEHLVEDMSDEAFQKHIQALAIRRLDKPKKLSAECAKYWGEIITQQYNFDRGEAPPTQVCDGQLTSEGNDCKVVCSRQRGGVAPEDSDQRKHPALLQSEWLNAPHPRG